MSRACAVLSMINQVRTLACVFLCLSGLALDASAYSATGSSARACDSYKGESWRCPVILENAGSFESRVHSAAVEPSLVRIPSKMDNQYATT